MGLGSVHEEIGVVRAQVNGLREEVNGEFEAVVDESCFCLLRERVRHCLETEKQSVKEREFE